MRLITSLILVLGISACASAPIATEAEQTPQELLDIFPQPKTVTRAAGAFVLKQDAQIWIDGDLKSDDRTETALSNYWSAAFEDKDPAFATAQASADFKITFDASFASTIDLTDAQREEAYALSVSAQSIEIRAVAAHGVYNALTTLSQIMSASDTAGAQALMVPFVSIVDYPHHEWRGFSIDTARHFRDIDFLYKAVDVLAQNKINRLHIHFSDDEAYRLQSSVYPKLNEIGSRGNTSFWLGVLTEGGQKPLMEVLGRDEEILFEFPVDQLPDAQYYTKDEIKGLVEYARERFIEVIPELDVPGHASAILRSYPELRLPYAPEGSDEARLATRVINVHDAATFEFVQTLLSEIHETFQSPRWVHIGGDEVNLYGPRLTMAEQATFIAAIGNYVESSLGSEPIIWNNHTSGHLNGGLESGIVQHWHYELETGEPEIYFSNPNLKHINSLAYHYYLDMRQSADGVGQEWAARDWASRMHDKSGDAEPLEGPFLLTAQDMYETEDHFEALTDMGLSRDLLEATTVGVEAALWSEFIVDDAAAWTKVLPRLTVFSETGWRAPRYKDPSAWSEPWDEYDARLKRAQFPRYETIGIVDYFGE